MISITLRFASLMEEIVVDPMLTNLFAYNVNAKKILQCLMAKSSMVYAMLLFSLMVNAIQKTTMLSVVLMGVIVSLFKVIFGLFFLPFLTFKNLFSLKLIVSTLKNIRTTYVMMQTMRRNVDLMERIVV